LGELREQFPSPGSDTAEKEKRLDKILAENSYLAHAFIYDEKEKGIVFRSQPAMMGERYFREEHDRAGEGYDKWFSMEGPDLLEGMHKKKLPFMFYTGPVKRPGGDAYMVTALFTLPDAGKRTVIAGTSFDPCFLKQTFFPQAIEE